MFTVIPVHALQARKDASLRAASATAVTDNSTEIITVNPLPSPSSPELRVCNWLSCVTNTPIPSDKSVLMPSCFGVQSPSTPETTSPASSFKKTSDAERQRELRERARKLIEEARSGMNKPEVPGIAAMAEDARRRKEEMVARTKGENHAIEAGSEAPKPDLRLKKIMLTRPELAVTMATTAAKLGTNDSEGMGRGSIEPENMNAKVHSCMPRPTADS